MASYFATFTYFSSLCRLAVDISPIYDDDSADDDHDDDAKDNAAAELIDSNKAIAKQDTREENILQKQNIKYANRQHHNNGGHYHCCNWYSRHNTPDKQAKDIYNHEHVGDVSLESFQTMPLDSEFKRCVEEEGNDFKEEIHLCEVIDNNWENGNHNFPPPDSGSDHIPQHNCQYFQLSPSFDDDDRLKNGTSQSCTLVGGDNVPTQCSSIPRYNNSVSQVQWRHQNNMDRNENFCHVETPFCNADQDENADDENEDNSPTYTAEVSSVSEDELPVDLDEDIDVNDKMVLFSSHLVGLIFCFNMII